MGFRRLGDIDYYRDDLMVMQLFGLNRIPDVVTVSRGLASLDQESIVKIRGLCREWVIVQLQKVPLVRLTLDFDGSVCWKKGQRIEGTAVGYNKKKKGARSYYPLFCMIAQTRQAFVVYHRPGNVQDSKRAREFIASCIEILRRALP